jgi:CheY-like chemotaxis protein
MFMKSAHIAVFEDSKQAQQLIDLALLGSEHRIVATAETRHDALKVVELMQVGKLAVDVVLLDGNLDKGISDFSDAFAIYDKLQRRSDQMPIVVGISSSLLTDEGLPIPREYDLSKDGLFDQDGLSPLVCLLDEMPEPVTASAS